MARDCGGTGRSSSQYNFTTSSTPKAASNLGTAMPPVELTQSITTMKFFALMASHIH